MVRCFSFPPGTSQSLKLLHQEEMAHAREDEVPRHRPVVSDLEVVHAQFALLLLEALLYVPAVERHMEQNFKGGSLRGVGDKVFVLVRKADGRRAASEPKWRPAFSSSRTSCA